MLDAIYQSVQFAKSTVKFQNQCTIRKFITSA